ncbi:hypothetical protein [Mucilaginibacter sp.]
MPQPSENEIQRILCDADLAQLAIWITQPMHSGYVRNGPPTG